MRPFIVPFGAILVLTGFLSPAAAGDTGWHLRVFGTAMDAHLAETVSSSDGTDVRVSGSSALGFGGAVEYQFHDRLGAELGLVSASPGVELRADVPGFGMLAVEDSLSTQALTLDLNVHLTPAGSALDAILGGGYAKVFLGDLSYDVPVGGSLAFGTETGSSWTIKAGLDYTFGESGWGLTAGLRYIDAGFDASQRGDPANESRAFDNDLVIVSVGVALGF